MCLTPCTVTNGGTSFSVSTPNTAATGLIADVEAAEGSQTLAANCNNDFLIFPGGFDPNPVNPLVVTDPTNANDRYCGERFNPQLVATVSSTVCSNSLDFHSKQFKFMTKMSPFLQVLHKISCFTTKPMAMRRQRQRKMEWPLRLPIVEILASALLSHNQFNNLKK